jgi:eukaryotic-like serine/threonine-protein kinase
MMQVVFQLAERLKEMHAAGFVHRDLKPANVMWLPSQNRWTVIDFGCAAKKNKRAPLAYSLCYAPPEVIAAKRRGENTMLVEESIDAWSLGVMAFEMATGVPGCTFPQGTSGDQVCHFLISCNLSASVFLNPKFVPHF